MNSVNDFPKYKEPHKNSDKSSTLPSNIGFFIDSFRIYQKFEGLNDNTLKIIY